MSSHPTIIVDPQVRDPPMATITPPPGSVGEGDEEKNSPTPFALPRLTETNLGDDEMTGAPDAPPDEDYPFTLDFVANPHQYNPRKNTCSNTASCNTISNYRHHHEQKGPAPQPTGLRVTTTPINPEDNNNGASQDIKCWTPRALFMAFIISMGGLIFGYGGIGQIGGFLLMGDYRRRFGDVESWGGGFSNVRVGTIVGMLLIGALVGSLIAAPITDRFGRKQCIAFWATIFALGQIIEISTSHAWYQLVIGRTIEGLGIGALSILTPLYMSETAPKEIRATMISAYQLFITLGIFLASMINFNTHILQNSTSWRLTMGISLIFPTIMALGIQWLDESPRWDYRRGNIAKAGRTIAKTYSVAPDHPHVVQELQEIQTALNEERNAEDVKWFDVFTAPTMLKRIVIGCVLQIMQQMTGANYFFYFGPVLFSAAGVGNGYIFAIVLGAVNFGATFGGIWIAGHLSRRKTLIIGALAIAVCHLIYAAMGANFVDQFVSFSSMFKAGVVMIVFSCSAIIVFATTWGPVPWVICAEIYPARYRAVCMAMATACNWTFNFLIGFFTPFITEKIGYSLGYVYGGTMLAGSLFVWYFVYETQGKSLEAIDRMILDGVKPCKSARVA